MKTNQLSNTHLFLAMVLIGGCAVGPNYKKPAVDTPANFRFAPTQITNSFGDLPWWEVFKDPYLQDLIRASLTNNYDLKQAVARVEQTRQLAVVARAPLFPSINYGGDVGRGRNARLGNRLLGAHPSLERSRAGPIPRQR